MEANNTRDDSISRDVADMILIKKNKNEVVLLKKRVMYVKPSPLRPPPLLPVMSTPRSLSLALFVPKLNFIVLFVPVYSGCRVKPKRIFDSYMLEF
jgi:hypothetical protein